MKSTPSTRDSAEATAWTIAREQARRLRQVHRRYVLRQLLCSPTFLIGALITLFWIAVALSWRWVVPYDPLGTDPVGNLQPPSGEHWLGTDSLGRDVLSRTLAGAAPVLSIAPAATAAAVLVGTLLGLAAGYYRGLMDDLLMRTVDAFLALPGLLIAIMVLALLGPSVINVIVVITIFFAPNIGRTVRSAVLSEREREYISAARLRGERGWYIMLIEILPNVKAPIIVEATVRLGYAVFLTATLSFLGLALSPPSPDWGLTIASARGELQVAPWTVLAPAIALATLVVGVNLIVDGLKRAVSD